MHILAKPKHGTSNLINDRFYASLEAEGVLVTPWTAARMLRCGYDVLHVHWPENVLGKRSAIRAAASVAALLAAMAWVRLRGRKIVWTAHNLKNHDGLHPRLERVYWACMTRLLSGFIALSDVSREKALELRPALRGKPSVVVPHGNYTGIYPDEIAREAARKRLGIPANARALLNLGILRRYKKVERLLHLAAQRPDYWVIIAGNPLDPGYHEELEAMAQGLPNVRLCFGFVPDSDLQVYLRAADVQVLPYDQITNSGSAILALSFDLPVLAPRLECFEALADEFGDDWVACYEGSFKTDVVDAFFQSANRRPGARVQWGRWEWDHIAKTVAAFMESLR